MALYLTNDEERALLKLLTLLEINSEGPVRDIHDLTSEEDKKRLTRLLLVLKKKLSKAQGLQL